MLSIYHAIKCNFLLNNISVPKRFYTLMIYIFSHFRFTNELEKHVKGKKSEVERVDDESFSVSIFTNKVFLFELVSSM